MKELDDNELLVPLPEESDDQPIIKVIGVGGGGGNAVGHMFRSGVAHVEYVVCNTDRKALVDSPVPHRLAIGELGVGGRPEEGRRAAEEHLEEICAEFGANTKMVFITAGMGGGTGTGASPVIAREAKKRGVLTVGIVTIPFLFEHNHRINLALDGVERLAAEVDALLVINNERLREIYADLSVVNAFRKADDVLTNAARSIVDIIYMHGMQDLDFADVVTALTDSNVAIIATGYGEGENRLTAAIAEALRSPLLNNNNIYHSTHLRMAVWYDEAHEGGMQMAELDEISAFMAGFNVDIDTKYGYANDPTLGAKIKVTLLASGFGLYDRKSHGPSSASGEASALSDERIRLIHSIYGTEGSSKARSRKQRSNVYLYTLADLDNADLAERVDASPTAHRTLRQLAELSGDEKTTSNSH